MNMLKTSYTKNFTNMFLKEKKLTLKFEAVS